MNHYIGTECSSWSQVFLCYGAMASAPAVDINQTMYFHRIYCDNPWALGITPNCLLASPLAVIKRNGKVEQNVTNKGEE